MASRYVAALDKLERNYTGDELTAKRAKLEEVYQAGKSGMIDGYTRLLQDDLGISADDAQAVRDSFCAILRDLRSGGQRGVPGSLRCCYERLPSGLPRPHAGA